MSNVPERVDFQPHQVLRTRDFQDEQSYQLSMRWRHHLGLHPWGIVRGLLLVQDEGQVRVQPGLAIDGYGREIVLSAVEPVPALDPRNEPGPLDVWIQYDQERLPAKRKVGADRVRERPTVTTSRTALRPVADDVRQPPGVAADDLEFGPERPPPSDPAQGWRVFLGSIQYVKKSDADPGAWSIDLAGRPYVSAVAGSIVSPSSRLPSSPRGEGTIPSPGAELRFEEGEARPPDPAPGGAADATADGSPPQAAPSVRLTLRDGGDGIWTPLSIDFEATTLQGDQVTLDGDLIVRRGGALEFDPNPKRDDEDTGLVGWRIYHRVTYPDPTTATITPAGAGGLVGVGAGAGLLGAIAGAGQLGATQADELRVVLPADLANFKNKVVVGFLDPDDKQFKPSLEIRGDNVVIVYGNLVVNGTLHATLLQAPGGATLPEPSTPDQVAAQLLGNDQIRPKVIQKILSTPQYLNELVGATGAAKALGQKIVAEHLADLVDNLDTKVQTVVEAMFDSTATPQPTYPQQIAKAVANKIDKFLPALASPEVNKLAELCDALAAEPTRMEAVTAAVLKPDPVQTRFADTFGKFDPQAPQPSPQRLTALLGALSKDTEFRRKTIRANVVAGIEATDHDGIRDLVTALIATPAIGQEAFLRFVLKLDEDANHFLVTNVDGVKRIEDCFKTLPAPPDLTPANLKDTINKNSLGRFLFQLRKDTEPTATPQANGLFRVLITLATAIGNLTPWPPSP
jgi:hypothetical protein